MPNMALEAEAIKDQEPGGVVCLLGAEKCTGQGLYVYRDVLADVLERGRDASRAGT